MKTKKIPLRMCIACREMKPKRELLRVVRKHEGGEIAVDLTGKMSGRGAYICPGKACFARARKSKGLERTFECEIPSDVYDRLEREVQEAEPADG